MEKNYLDILSQYVCDPPTILSLRTFVGLLSPKTRPNWPGKVHELIQVPRGQGVGLQGPRGSSGRPTMSQGVKG